MDIEEEPSYIHICTSQLGEGWIQIAIADNGPGIPEAVQEKIFNPFFTTKPIRKGTGMGMSISYQIITEHHGGKLLCRPTPEGGATLVIQIPIHQCQQRHRSPHTRYSASVEAEQHF
jgi:signal transduction histidine kinase